MGAMISLRCQCGQTFQVNAEHAGMVVMAPCCQTQVQVPAGVQKPVSPKPVDQIKITCPCGQPMVFARPAGPVEVACPSCQQRLQVGGAAQQPTAPEVDFSNLPPAATSSGPLRPTPPQSPQRGGSRAPPQPSPGFSPAARPPAARKKKTFKRIPRLGWFADEEGVPTLAISGIVMLAIMCAIGIGIKGLGQEHMEAAAESESWVAADGEIVTSGFTTEGLGHKQKATISVVYKYTVGDATYTGTRFSFEKMDSFRTYEAEINLKPYPPGAKCTVYHDPEYPSRSVLIKGARSRNQVYFYAGIFFIVVGIVLFVDCLIGCINAVNLPKPQH